MCSDPAFGAAEVGGTARLRDELWCEEHSQVSLLSQEESVPSPSSRIQLHPRARVRLREGRDREQREQCLTSWGTPGDSRHSSGSKPCSEPDPRPAATNPWHHNLLIFPKALS